VASPELRLVVAAEGRGRPPSRRAALLLGLFVLLAAVAATWLDAAEARRVVDVREAAETALQQALERGSDDPSVRGTLIRLRRTLGWRPLESKTRVIYSSLVLGLATRLEDMRLAAFHADRAAELAPVTVPVVRSAVLVLASTGDLDRALELTRRMFGYDAARAAATLADVEAFALGAEVDEALPAAPEAWMAWWRELRLRGRHGEADELLARTHARWPDHVAARVPLASRAFSRGDWELLATIVPPDAELPRRAEAAPLFAWRAHLRYVRGDRAGALDDIETAVGLRPFPWIRALAGDLYERMGEIGLARREWSRGLHQAASLPDSRRGLLLRLARLEDRHGEPAAALRHWRALLELDPDHAEARRRLDDLSGFQR
jgi:tetratricopeptide (TPR) repeat protein